jgi:L-amino acid N-acyltransferase YncA
LSGFCFAFLGNLIFMELGRQDRSTPLIRLAEEGDALQIAAIYAPVVRDTIISFETEPPSVEEIARRVRDTLVRWPWLVCERDKEVLGYVYAGIALPNNASVGLHEAMGFRLVGVYRGVGYKLGAWRYVEWWGLALREGAASEARPSPPIALPSATEDDGWNAALERGLRLPRSGA